MWAADGSRGAPKDNAKVGKQAEALYALGPCKLKETRCSTGGLAKV